MTTRAFSFDPFQQDLYTADDLLREFSAADPQSYERTLDFRVYREYVMSGEYAPSDYFVSMMRALHDNSITHAMYQLLNDSPRVIAVMGGHKLERNSLPYRQIVNISRRLAAADVLVTSGGGPGAMEAAHLGAALVTATNQDVDQALEKLAASPSMPATKGIVSPAGLVDASLVEAVHRWYCPAIELSRTLSASKRSLAIPTWHYGHEPPTPFATQIGKYFQNSIREDGLLAVAKHGFVFAEGKAGTLQEIFQDAAQNYYESFGWFSPMVLLGVDYWTKRFPAVPVLRALFGDDRLSKFVMVTDSAEECVDFLMKFEPPS